MPQTKFVLSKALKLGLKPIVVINKIDRSDARPKETLEEIFDLFLALEANDYQLDFHVLYASGRQGWAVRDLEGRAQGPRRRCSSASSPTCPRPSRSSAPGDAYPFTMLVTTLEADPYLGRVLTGRIESGAITVNRQIKALSRDGHVVERARATKLLAFRGLARVPIERAEAGDIVAIAGLEDATVADTLCDIEVETADSRQSDRSADARDHGLGQRFPACRPRRRQGAEPRHPRPPVARGRRQCRDPGARSRTTAPTRSPAAANCSWAC